MHINTHINIRRKIPHVFHTSPKCVAILLTPLLFISTFVIAKQNEKYPNTHEFVLENGLKLIVREDHRAPVFTSMIWYKIGSVDEPRGKTGISHMLEHMMFKGTPSLKANEHSRLISNAGGQDNAFTSQDYTAYYEVLPSTELALAFKLEADRMQNLTLKEEDFKPEQQVVAEERRARTDSNPQALFYEAFNAFQWSSSHYRNPIIGYAPEIQALKLKDLQGWYDAYYAPNNASLIVVGDINPEETYRLAQKTFGKLPKRNILPLELNFEMPQQGTKRLDYQVPAKLPALVMSYKTPSFNSSENKKEADALFMLAAILEGGKSARLPKHLVREQKLVSDIAANYDHSKRFDGTFTIYATPAQTENGQYVLTNLIEEAILQEIEMLKNTAPTQDELERIFAQLHAQLIYQKDSIIGQAQAIGMAETTGEGWENSEAILERLIKITPSDIQNVALKYLIPKTLSIGTLSPLALKSDSESTAESPTKALMNPTENMPSNLK